MIRSELRTAWWVLCAAPDCGRRCPEANDDVDSWDSRDEAYHFAVDMDWVPTPDSRIYCPKHGDQLCRGCARFMGVHADAFDHLCAFCRATYRQPVSAAVAVETIRARSVMFAPIEQPPADRLRAEVLTPVDLATYRPDDGLTAEDVEVLHTAQPRTVATSIELPPDASEQALRLFGPHDNPYGGRGAWWWLWRAAVCLAGGGVITAVGYGLYDFYGGA